MAAKLTARWRDLAACLGMNQELFFPVGDDGRHAVPAKVTCANCQVQDHCLDWALSNGADFGIWGGLTSQERRDLVIRRHHHRGS